MPERFNRKTSQATNELITEQVTCLMAGRVTWLAARLGATQQLARLVLHRPPATQPPNGFKLFWPPALVFKALAAIVY
jgi:hypothetical protein